jgi:hypothetical protein
LHKNAGTLRSFGDEKAKLRQEKCTSLSQRCEPLAWNGLGFEQKFREVKKIHDAKRAQIDMFEKAIPPEMKKLEFLKCRVQVSWLCKTSTCGGHRMQVLDLPSEPAVCPSDRQQSARTVSCRSLS